MSINKTKKKNPKAVEYVNNKLFYSELKKYYKEVEKDPNIPIPESIGELIYKIALNYSTKSTFSKVQFSKDEMISEGVYYAIRAIKRKTFDVNFKDNPFAYFTQVIHNGFLKKINAEEKEKYVNYKSIDYHFSEQEAEFAKENIFIHNILTEDIHEFMVKFEQKKKERAEKNKEMIKHIKDTKKNSKLNKLGLV